MSTKKKRKPKPRAPRKGRAKPARKRKTVEEKAKEAVIEKREEKISVEPPEKPLLLAVRILGPFGAPTHIERSLRSLKLNRRFRAVLLNNNESAIGALRETKDYVTWGEVGSHDVAALLKKRGELSSGMPLSDKFVKENLGHGSLEELAKALTRGQVELKILHQKGVQPVFKLHPPSGGFGASVKRPFRSQGELGYRGTEISHLLERMM